jgi:hypothetical protein
MNARRSGTRTTFALRRGPQTREVDVENLCRQLGVCTVVPAEWHWLMAAVIPLLVISLVAIPVANVLRRTGRSRWWTVLGFVPGLNLIALWVFAFSRWPTLDQPSS